MSTNGTSSTAEMCFAAAEQIEALRVEHADQHGLLPAQPDETEAQRRRSEARLAYLASVEKGEPMSSQALGELFGRSRTWARDRIVEARGMHGMPPVDEVLGGEPKKPDQTPACHPATTALEAAVDEDQSNRGDSPTVADSLKEVTTGMPVTPPRAWPVLLLALPAFVAIWGGWVGLGELTGFGPVNLLPGIGSGFTINTAITLPIGVEAYAAFALRTWLASGTQSARARSFAMWSAIASLLLGMAGQVAFHLMQAAGMTHAPWQITTFVSCLPVVVLGCGAALAHLLHNNERN